MDVMRLKKRVRELTKNYLQWFEVRGGFHKALQRELMEEANLFGLVGLKEFKCELGYIDNAWVDSDNNLIVAIEIDTARKQKSLKKLIDSNAKYKIWIYVGTNDLEEIIMEYGDLELDILSPYESDTDVHILIV